MITRVLACVGRDFQKRCPNAGSWTLTSIANSIADANADLSIRGSSGCDDCVNLALDSRAYILTFSLDWTLED